MSISTIRTGWCDLPATPSRSPHAVSSMVQRQKRNHCCERAVTVAGGGSARARRPISRSGSRLGRPYSNDCADPPSRGMDCEADSATLLDSRPRTRAQTDRQRRREDSRRQRGFDFARAMPAERTDCSRLHTRARTELCVCSAHVHPGLIGVECCGARCIAVRRRGQLACAVPLLSRRAGARRTCRLG